MRTSGLTHMALLFTAACSSDPSFGILGGQDGTVKPEDFAAICTVGPTPVQPIHEEATWFGDETLPPENATIKTYQWTLISKPVGSAAELPPHNPRQPNVEGFTADLAGTYVAELIAIDEFGNESDPCVAELLADPVESLWVELYWEIPKDDLDLHLVRNTTGEFGDPEDDCFHETCKVKQGMLLNWGNRNKATDDPRLDLDDLDGTGPENINLDTPGEDYYTVWVLDYSFRRMPDPNTATVNVYMDGDLVLSEQRVFEGEGKKMAVAEIIWEDRHVNSLE